MTPRHIALVAGAVLVLGLGVYLYVAVQSTSSAVANVAPTPSKPRPAAREEAPKAPGARASTSKDHRRNTASEAPRAADTNVRTDASTLDKDAIMASANRAYDIGDFDEAMTIAKRVLSGDPRNARMLRIMVSSSCILGDTTTAQQNYLLLDVGGKDRADMRRRCDQYGITFTET